MTGRADLAAVVLAAGYSSRMGAFKPLLPFGSATVIEHVLRTLQAAGLDVIRAVVGWNAHLVTPVLERSGIRWVMNARFAEGMYSSIQAGVQSLPADTAAFFLMPGDMPLLAGATLTRLIEVWDAAPGGILRPCHQGRRGHPPLIAATYIPEILREAPPGGLRALLDRHRDAARDVEVADHGILADLDTPEDYKVSRARPDAAS